MSRWGRFLAAAMVVAGGAWLALGAMRGVPSAPPRPVADYDEALRRIARMGGDADSLVNPLCRTRLLTHGEKAPRAIVLFHGFTNCPRQFDRLGLQFARLGFNVLIPRQPRHGLRDRMTTALGTLTAEDWAATAEEAIDIAHGLGDRVSVAGLSTSGIVVGWLAQNRPDIDRAMLIAPSFAPKKVPLNVSRRLTSILLAVPNFFVWWDSERKQDVPGPEQAYPRFASRSLAEAYRLGHITLDQARRSKPAARSIVIVTTAMDEGVNNQATEVLARRWHARGANVRTFEFADSLGMHHDMIDPDQPYQRVDLAYPLILDLMAGRDTGGPGR